LRGLDPRFHVFGSAAPVDGRAKPGQGEIGLVATRLSRTALPSARVCHLTSLGCSLWSRDIRYDRSIGRHSKEIMMKLSARNQLKGKIVAVTKGQTTAHIRIDIGGGVIVTSSITNEAVDDLALKVGDDAFAVIKASDVMVAK
jgi:molybdopterin-binding protein